MTPYEALYGRDCRTPLNWSKVGERRLYGNKKVNEAEEKVKQVQIALEATQGRYKAYANEHRRKVEYQIGDYVYFGEKEKETSTKVYWSISDICQDR